MCVCVLGVVYLIVATFVWLFIEISEFSRYKYSAVDALIKHLGVNNLIGLLKSVAQSLNMFRQLKNVFFSLKNKFQTEK